MLQRAPKGLLLLLIQQATPEAPCTAEAFGLEPRSATYIAMWSCMCY